MTDKTHVRKSVDEWALNLLKDGGRKVMDGGDPYEDDLEPPWDLAPAAHGGDGLEVQRQAGPPGP